MNKPELKSRRDPRTPRSNELEAARLAMKLPRTPAYGDALKLCRHLEAELQQAQSRIADLEQQSQRLDWMDKDAGEQVYSVGTTWYARSACGRPHHKQKDLRAAIDTARGINLPSEPKPNPQLQQAAPELLHALKALLNQTNSFELAQAYDKARTAIAKAEGHAS